MVGNEKYETHDMCEHVGKENYKHNNKSQNPCHEIGLTNPFRPNQPQAVLLPSA